MITAAHKRLCPSVTSANLSPKIVPPKASVNLPISQSTLQVGNLFLACISHTSLKSLSTRYDVCRRRRILGRCMCSGSPAIDHLPSLQEIRSVKDKPFYCHSSLGHETPLKGFSSVFLQGSPRLLFLILEFGNSIGDKLINLLIFLLFYSPIHSTPPSWRSHMKHIACETNPAISKMFTILIPIFYSPLHSPPPF